MTGLVTRFVTRTRICIQSPGFIDLLVTSSEPISALFPLVYLLRSVFVVAPGYRGGVGELRAVVRSNRGLCLENASIVTMLLTVGLTVSMVVDVAGCGTRQDPQRVFTNNVVVRFHPGLEMDGDEVITIVCRYPPPVAPAPPAPPASM